MRSNQFKLAVQKQQVFAFFILFFFNVQAPSFAQCTNDNAAPVITPVSTNIKIILGPSGTKTIVLADIATVTDNCNPVPLYNLSKTSFNCSDRGQQTITVNATDGQFGSALTPSNVRFLNIGEIKFDLAGNLFIADIQNNRMRKLAPNGDVTTLAGNGIQGFTDGTGTGATLTQPNHFTLDNSGNIFLSDPLNNRIRKITPAGVVTTYAGSTQGNTNGNLSVAKFNSPRGLVFDNLGNLFVADMINSVIRKITPSGTVSTFAGNGTYTTVDGTGINAGINGPHGLTIDANNNLYVTELYGNTIRKITPSGIVTTIAGNGNPGSANGPALIAEFKAPKSLAFDQAGNLYIADDNFYIIRKLRTDGVLESISTPNDWINNGVAINSAGLLYYSTLSSQIKKILSNGTIQLIAGNSSSGFQDGNVGATGYGNQSSLQIIVTVEQAPPVFTSSQQPEITITIGANCTAPIPDFKSSATATSGCGAVTLTQSPTQGVPAPLGRRPVTIIATDIYGMQTYQTSYITIVDGTAPVITPVSNNIVLPLDANGTRTITLADVASVMDNCNSNPLVTINPSSFNCSSTGTQTITVTATDGTFGGPLTPSAVSFNNPFGLDFDAEGNMYIADQRNNKIRKISASGIVSSVAGNGSEGFANGTGVAAIFNDPRGIAIDGAGNVYTSDIDNHKIRKITPAGVVTTYAGSTQGYSDGNITSAQFSSPRGLAFDAQGNLYVADAYNARIRKITPAGVVTTVAGNGNYSSIDGSISTASIYDPVDVAVDAAGNIYVAEASGNKIRKISTSGIVSTMAGDGTYGFNDGAASSAKFAGPQALAVDNTGNIYVADFGNNRIRKISTNNLVSTIVNIGYPSGITIGANGHLYMTDFGNNIKMITLSGVVTTIAGGYTPGAQDGSIGVLASGNQTTLQIPVTITGQSIPVFSTTQANVSISANANCTATLPNYVSSASATSSCGGAVIIIQSPVAGTILPVGITTVTLTATDASNNSATQIFSVTVLKSNAPLITPLSNNIIIPLAANGTTVINSTDIATITDCDHSPSTIVSPSVFTCADIGTTTVTVTATDGTFGTPNPAAVSFQSPLSTVVDAAGNIYVAANNQIRKISTSGVVSTLAGSGVEGSNDGIGLSASFYALHGLAIDAAGNLYTAEFYSRKVRKVSPAGVVTTLAGSGVHGSTDGPAASASFGVIYGVAVDNDGNVYVADASNNKIRKISTSGMVSTYAGTGISGSADGQANTSTFSTPVSLAVDSEGNLYVGEQFKIRKITTDGIVSTFAGSNLRGNLPGIGTNARMERPMGMVFDASGNLFATQEGAGRILKITPNAEVSTFAGSYGETTINGTGTAATFRSPEGLSIDANGNLYVADWFLNNIRKITPTAVVTTFAGSGVAGSENGNIGGITGNYTSLQIQVTIKDVSAPVITPVSNNLVFPLNTNGTRTITIADIANVTDNCNTSPNIRISPTEFTCSDIGLQTITVEATDGIFGLPNPGAVSFTQPAATAVDQSGNVYVAEWGNKIRKISTNGEVTTIAGSGIFGFADGQGTDAAFRDPTDLVVDQSGNIFVADVTNRRIRKITPAGYVSTFAGNGTIGATDGIGTNASFDSPYSLAIDLQGNLYVGDRDKVRKISATGVVTTLAGGNEAGFADGNGTEARFWGIAGLVTDAAGNIYVADGANNRVRKITTEGVVTTIAGNGGQGYLDGPVSSAKFTFLHAITRDGIGNLYVCDNDNRRIRKISPDGIVSTFSGSGLQGDQDGSATTASFNGITGISIDNAGYLYVAEFSTNKIRKISPNGSVITLAGSGVPGTVDGNVGGTTGNLSSLQIPITISDNINPIINCPANITTPASSIHPDQTGWATATDNCTAVTSIVITYSDNTSQGCNIIRTWKATDASGNYSTCVQTISIPQMTVTLGPDMYILYGALGYTGCRTITPVVTGGVGPYTYNWTSTQASVNNATSSTITACNTTELTHTYTVTVTAANGCIATATLNLSFINISCSNNVNSEKVTVCLRPQGNTNNCNTVCVSPSAAQVLINNGSYYGKCLLNCAIPVQATSRITTAIAEPEEEVYKVHVMGNPSQSEFVLSVTSSSKEKITIRLKDATGKLLEVKENISVGQTIKLGFHYAVGVYFAEVTQNGNRKIVKLVKQ